MVASMSNVLQFWSEHRRRNGLDRHPMPALGARHHKGWKARRRSDRTSHLDATVFIALISSAFSWGVKQFCAAHTNAPQRGMPWLIKLLFLDNGL
jgi:hypothetical protein